jgi:hypothetical protein
MHIPRPTEGEYSYSLSKNTPDRTSDMRFRDIGRLRTANRKLCPRTDVNDTSHKSAWRTSSRDLPTEGAPSLRFLQGWMAMLRVLFDFVVDT